MDWLTIKALAMTAKVDRTGEIANSYRVFNKSPYFAPLWVSMKRFYTTKIRFANSFYESERWLTATIARSRYNCLY